MTRSRLGVLLTIVLLLTVTAFSGAAAGAPGAQKERPLKVNLEISSTDPDPGLACGTVIPTGQVGTGHISHLGRVEISGGHCTDLMSFPLVELTNGRGTYVAANGDTIEITYSARGAFTDDGVVGSGTVEIVDGTGRFHAASGAFDFTVTTPVLADGSLGTTLLEGQGWIAYDASNRNTK